jgi:serine/threonine protein kinase
MAKVTAFGQPVNDIERDAIAYLRGHLPDSYEIFHNLEIKQNQEVFEIDLIILAPQCVFVVDIKGVRGLVEVCGSKWHPENRQPFYSPVAKLRQHAKVLSSLISETNRMNPELRRVHVQAAVLMMPDCVEFVDPDGKDEGCVTYCDRQCLKYFQSLHFIPERRLKDIRPFLPTVRRAIQGKASPKSSPLRYRDWQVEEKLGGSDRYIEYRAKKEFIDGLTVRLRVYKVDPYQDTKERESERKLISNAFQAVLKISAHPNILGVRDFFETDDGDSFVLITDDPSGQSLRQQIKKQNLSLEQKLGIMREVLIALDHAHKSKVIHRHLTPDNILIGADGQARLAGFDYARISSRTSTIAHDIIDDLEEDAVYQAVECYRDPSQASIASDLFSAGLVFYELLTGKQAFESAEQICDRAAIFPVKPSEIQPELSPGLDRWLQNLCAFEPQNRFPNADAALQELTTLATLQTIDLTSLAPGSSIDDRYRVLERLGNPGSFAVAYKVDDRLGDEILVLKLVTRDRRSVYDRLRQEYKTLKQVPSHPHVVKAIWAGELKDGTPFITFEYIEGQDVELLIKTKQLSLEQAVQIAQQTASGLEHLHQHGVYHQDIKPSNLLFTERGVRIIDFNIAVSDRDEETVNAGTRRYLPSDFKPTSEPTATQKRDRDLYALGITFYECVTGCYPFSEPKPPIGKQPRNPRQLEGCEDLSEELVQLIVKAIAPKQSERFTCAKEFLDASAALPSFKKTEERLLETSVTTLEESKTIEAPNLEIAIPETQLSSNTLSIPSSPPIEPAKKSIFDLFAPVASLPNPDCTTSEKLVVLDPTGLYELPPDYIAIATEVEWMRSFFVTQGRYWVKGKRLCDWTSEWLRVWNKTEAIAQIKQNPRDKLTTLFHPIPIPEQWTDRQLLTLANRLDSYPQEHPIAHLLADFTIGDLKIWHSAPSIGNLAAWLAIQVPEECKPLEKVWRNQFQDHNLAVYYQTEDKLILLRQWLGIAEPAIPELGEYPLPVPDLLAEEFDRYWEQKLYLSEAQALDELIPTDQVGMERIADVAYKVLRNRPHLITKARETKLASYLTHQQKRELRDREPPPQPQSLALDASPKQALTWATEQYLPFRRWEIAIQQPPAEQKISERLADSFVQWMLKHYPQMKLDPVERSDLNYSVVSFVRDLCQESPVLWVMVDGLGWLEHLELLSLLTKNDRLAVETSIQPRFSILPTKTEYAKWSLYAQLTPSSPYWAEDINKGFSLIEMGKRYPDGELDKLHRDLKIKAHSLYCWDTDQFDCLYHAQKDWHNLYRVQRPHILEGIAREINYCLQQYPNSNELRIVIASDRGQMFGVSEQITHCPPGLEPKGRMAIGKTDDPNFVVLDKDRYGLPYDISVVRGSASLGSLSYTANKEIIGSNGGLFPEEVVIGVSVLRKSVQRSPVLITCHGEGKPRESGQLEITINNPNSVPLTDVCLYVRELPSLTTGQPLTSIIPANDKVSLKIDIPECPELSPTHQGNQLSLSGELTFSYANSEAGTAELDSKSTFVVKQIFSSGLNIDEFL